MMLLSEFDGPRSSSPTPSLDAVELMDGPPPPPSKTGSQAPMADTDPACMDSACDALKTSISELEQEVRKLRMQAEQSSTTNWILIAAVVTVLVVCIAFCVQSSRQLSHATEVLAWSCGQRKQAAPYFQPIP